MTFIPSGIITLTTDFGHKGVFVGTMKGQMLRHYSGATLVDLTHDTQPHWPDEAGFWLARAYRYFPPGTVHVAVVDPGVGTERQIICAQVDGHLLLAPDNGLLGLLLQRSTTKLLHQVELQRLSAVIEAQPSQTFHGRDIFAPLSARLASGALSIDDLGPKTEVYVPAWLDPPGKTAGKVSGVVVTVDNFGNLITNIDADLVNEMTNPVVSAGGRHLEFVQTYGDRKPGSYMALVNSFDVVEIARAEQSAAAGLGLGHGAPVTIEPAH